MRFILLGHLGIGDHIFMNGLVNNLLKSYENNLEEICIIALEDYRSGTLKHMYEDNPKISFHWINNNIIKTEDDELFSKINQTTPGTHIHYKDKDYFSFSFGLHSDLKSNWFLPGYTWIDAMYKYPLDVDPTLRFSNFQCPQNLQRAEEKYIELLSTIKSLKYVILHDDPSRNRFMNYSLVKDLLKKDKMEEYHIIYLGKDRYSYPLIENTKSIQLGNLFNCQSLFDLYYILKNASACHLMDSSIACLTDVLGIQCKLYMHSYMMENTGKAFTRNPWVRLE